MTIYFLPTSELGLNDQIFVNGKNYHGGHIGLPIWNWLQVACRETGIEIHTFEKWSLKNMKPDDVLLVQNHPGETLSWRVFYFLKNMKSRGGFILARRRFVYQNYKYFSRRVLIQGESPMLMPYNYYGNFEKIRRSGLYHKILPLSNYYDYRKKSIISPFFSDRKDKFLVMINANMTIHSFRDELYGERLKAIRYFAGVSDFDLYGYGWEGIPRHPFHFYAGSRVRRAWRGVAQGKMRTMSRYKFTLCFENCSYPGYMSEKIYDCLAAGSIPIYLGEPNIEKIIPPSCFIDLRRFSAKGGFASGEKNYDELHKLLKGLTEADLAKYRAAIKSFLNDDSTIRPMKQLVDEITGKNQ